MMIFNIIIPTRERADTLYWTIKSCLNQDYKNLIIWVSDNCSTDNTKDVVYSFNDERIRYIKTPERLSMTENFEYALSHISEGFVTFIGDDDGFLPNSISEIAKIIEDSKQNTICWQVATYIWNTVENEKIKGLLSIPLSNELLLMDSKETLKKISRDVFYSVKLPCLYWGFSHIDIIKSCKINNRFFYSFIPDTYSGMAISSKIDTYLYSYKPFTVSGTSHHSNALGFFSNKTDKASNQKFLKEKNIPIHNSIVLGPSKAILLAEPIIQACDRFNNIPSLNFKKLISQIIWEAIYSDSEEKCNQIINSVREISKKNHLSKYTDRILKKVSYKGPIMKEYVPFIDKTLTLKSNKNNYIKGIENIYDACLFIKSIIS